MKFSAVIMSCATPRMCSLVQLMADIFSTKDGSLYGPKRGPDDPFAATFITLNSDLYYTSGHPTPRLGPKCLEIMLQSTFKEVLGQEVPIERYGKPFTFNFNFVADMLQERAKKQRIKISNFYMIGDNPESDISGANAVGWTSILVKTGVFKADARTSKDGNDTKHPATYVVEDFKAAIDLIYKLEKLN